MPKGIAQFTITDINDITTGATVPTSPTIEQLWLDTSTTPPILKRYNGTSWVNAAVTPNDIDNAINNARTMAKLNGIELLNLEYMRDVTTANKPFLSGSYTIVPATEIGGNANEQNYIKIVNGTMLYTPYIACNPNTAQYFKISLYNKDTNNGTLYVQCCYYDKDKVQIATNETAITFTSLGNVSNSNFNVWNTYEGYIDALSSTDIRQRAVYMRVRVLPRYSGQAGTSYIKDLSWKQTSPQTLSNHETRINSAEQQITPTAIRNTVQLQRTNIYKVRYIRDWIQGSDKNTGNHWSEIKILDNNGLNLASGKIPTSNQTINYATQATDGILDVNNYCSGSAGTNQYIQIDLGMVYQSIESIVVWHYLGDSRIYNGTKTEVSEDGVTWYTLFDSAVEGKYIETSTGHSVRVNQSNSIRTSMSTFNDDGLTIEHTDSNTKTIMDSTSFQIVDNLTGRPLASLGMAGNSISKLLVDDISSASILKKVINPYKIVDDDLSFDVYVAPTATGDGSGRDVNNRIGGVQAAIEKIFGENKKFLTRNVWFHMAGGTYIEEVGIYNIMGTGVIGLDFSPSATFIGRIVGVSIYPSITIQGGGSNPGMNGDNTGAIFTSKYEYSDAAVFRFISCKYVYLLKFRGNRNRYPNTWPMFIEAAENSSVMVYNVDISNSHVLALASMSRLELWDTRGSNNDYVYVSQFCSIVGVHGTVSRGSSIVRYGSFANEHSLTGADSAFVPPAYKDVVQTNTWSATSYTSIRSGETRSSYFAQACWTGYPAWTGYASFSGIKSWLDGRKSGASITGYIYFRRTNTSHGSSSATSVRLYAMNSSGGLGASHPISLTLTRGGDGWATLPASFINGLADGSIIGVCVYSSSISDYIIFDNDCRIELTTTFNVRA